MRHTDLHRANLRVARRRCGFRRGHIALQILRMIQRSIDSHYQLGISYSSTRIGMSPMLAY